MIRFVGWAGLLGVVVVVLAGLSARGQTTREGELDQPLVRTNDTAHAGSISEGTSDGDNGGSGNGAGADVSNDVDQANSAGAGDGVAMTLVSKLIQGGWTVAVQLVVSVVGLASAIERLINCDARGSSRGGCMNRSMRSGRRGGWTRSNSCASVDPARWGA